jgi:hypothetical protein
LYVTLTIPDVVMVLGDFEVLRIGEQRLVHDQDAAGCLASMEMSMTLPEL